MRAGGMNREECLRKLCKTKGSAKGSEPRRKIRSEIREMCCSADRFSKDYFCYNVIYLPKLHKML